MPLIQRVDIFISSPSDVSAEREIILRVIEKLNRNPYIRRRYFLNPLAYERDVPPDGGEPAQLIIDRYMGEAKDSYLVICLMWTRMGTPFVHPKTGKEFRSGTEYEFLIAYEQKLSTGKPHLLLYRNIQGRSDDDRTQKAEVDAFFKRFEGPDADLKGLYKIYRTLTEFEEMLHDHIWAILNEHPPEFEESRGIDTANRPEIVEEVRRLDAAVPREVTVNQPTEIWAQICLPDSRGFRDLLPHETVEGDIIDQRDVREGNLAVAFPVFEGKLKPMMVSIEILAPDFAVQNPKQEILLSPHIDSGRLVFQATPKNSRKRSIIHVTVKSKTPDGFIITLGSASLSTEVMPRNVELGRVIWNLLALPLSTTYRGADRYQSEFRLEAIKNRFADESFDEVLWLLEQLERSEPNIYRESALLEVVDVFASNRVIRGTDGIHECVEDKLGQIHMLAAWFEDIQPRVVNFDRLDREVIHVLRHEGRYNEALAELSRIKFGDDGSDDKPSFYDGRSLSLTQALQALSQIPIEAEELKSRTAETIYKRAKNLWNEVMRALDRVDDRYKDLNAAKAQFDTQRKRFLEALEGLSDRTSGANRRKLLDQLNDAYIRIRGHTGTDLAYESNYVLEPLAANWVAFDEAYRHFSHPA